MNIGKPVSLLPSLLTLCNFACGFVSIMLCVQSIYWRGAGLEFAGKSIDFLDSACLIIFLGMIFDMMDGRVARMTNSQCQFGGELDSLADVCTFGVAPSVILGTFWIRVMPDDAQWWSLAMIAGVIYACCAALRLAMYNLSICEKAKGHFNGLPSPGAAGAVVGAALLFSSSYSIELWHSFYDSILQGIISSTPLAEKSWKVFAIYVYSVYFIIVGLLMVSPFRFAHLANLWFGKTKKFYTLIIVLLIIALLALQTRVILLCLGFNAYIVVCLFVNIRNRLRNREAEIDKDMEGALTFEDEVSEENPADTNGAN